MLWWGPEGNAPTWPSGVVAEFNDIASSLPIKLDGEVKSPIHFSVVANVVLPGFEVLNPVVPRLRKVVHVT